MSPTSTVTPLIQWSFDNTSASIDTSKLSSNYSDYFDIILFNNHTAKSDPYDSSDGHLYLDGNGHLICVPSTPDDQSYALSNNLIPSDIINPKSYEAWVYNVDLSQTKGGVIGIDGTYYGSGNNVTYTHIKFDSLVWAETDPEKRWQAGSEGHVRTLSFNGSIETNNNSYIHLVLVYDSDGTITMYHNGTQYGSPYTTTTQTFEANAHRFIFCQRHKEFVSWGSAWANPFNITYAAFYDVALSAEQAEALYCNKFIPNGESAQTYSDSSICAGYTDEPTSNPTVNPTTNPSYQPSYTPSSEPSNVPTTIPTPNPASNPTVSPLQILPYFLLTNQVLMQLRRHP